VPDNAAAFTSAAKELQPTVRMLLLKDVDHRGRVFYPNLQSRKARHKREVYTRQLVVG
jgi:pyridoxamine 5'-phosphate oxidase